VSIRVAGAAAPASGREVQGLFMSNWEEDDDAYCTSARTSRTRARSRPNSALRCIAPASRVSIVSGCSGIFCASTAPAARPIRLLCNREISSA